MKKKSNSVLAYLLGSLCAASIGLGLLLMIPSDILRIVLAIIIICLSICFGILTFNPMCLYGLITGVCMLVFPAYIVAIALLVIGNVGAIVNFFYWKKHFVK